MEWIALAKAVLPVLIENAPAAIKTAGEFFDWAKLTWEGAGEALGKPAADVTADELIAHIAQIRAQQAEIDAIP